MAGTTPLRLLLYLPPRLLTEQGRLDSFSKLSQVFRSCPSCRGLLILSRDRDRHGSTGSPGTSPRNSVTVPPSGGWFCSKCGIHLVPQLPGENVGSPGQNRPWTSPIDRGRSPHGSHEDIKGSQTSLRKDPATSPLGGIPLSPGKILDEHYDEWEKNIQASMTSMLQQMRGHFSLKSHQLKKLQVDLCHRERSLRVREESYTDRDHRIQQGEDTLRSKAERLQLYKNVMMSQLENKSRQLLKLHRKYHGNDADFDVSINVKGEDGLSLTNGSLNDILSPSYKPDKSSQVGPSGPGGRDGHHQTHSRQSWRDSFNQHHGETNPEQNQFSNTRKPTRDRKTDMNRSWHYSSDVLNDPEAANDTRANISLQFEPGTDSSKGGRNINPGKTRDSAPRPFMAFLNRSPRNSANPDNAGNLDESQGTTRIRQPDPSNTKRYPRQYIRDLYTGHQNNSNSVQNSPHSTLTTASTVSQQTGQTQKNIADPPHQDVSRWSSSYQYGRPVSNQTPPQGASQQPSPRTSQYNQQRSPQYNTQSPNEGRGPQHSPGASRYDNQQQQPPQYTTQQVVPPSMPNLQYSKQVSPRQSYTSHSSGQHSPKQTTANQYNVTYTSPQYTMSSHRTPHNQYNILSIANTQNPSAKPPQRPPYNAQRQGSPGGQYRNQNGVATHPYQNSMDSSKSSHGSAPPPPYSPNGPIQSKRSPRRVTEI